jgi:hypothetical protein
MHPDQLPTPFETDFRDEFQSRLNAPDEGRSTHLKRMAAESANRYRQIFIKPLLAAKSLPADSWPVTSPGRV